MWFKEAVEEPEDHVNHLTNILSELDNQLNELGGLEEDISYDVNVMFLDGSHDNWVNVKYFTETKAEISFKVFNEQWEKHVYMKRNIINYRVITNEKDNVREEENNNNE